MKRRHYQKVLGKCVPCLVQAASVKNEREQGCKSKNYRQKVIVQTQGACTGGQQLPELERNGMTYRQI